MGLRWDSYLLEYPETSNYVTGRRNMKKYLDDGFCYFLAPVDTCLYIFCSLLLYLHVGPRANMPQRPLRVFIFGDQLGIRDWRAMMRTVKFAAPQMIDRVRFDYIDIFQHPRSMAKE